MNLKRVIMGSSLSLVFLLFFTCMIYGVKLIFNNLLQTSSANSLSSILDSVGGVAAANDIQEKRNPQAEELNIYAQSVISISTNLSDTDAVLFSKNEQRKLSIASISKLMTAIIVLENFDPLREILISKEATSQSTDPERLKVGEIFYENDLLNAMLIGSDNAASYALSESIGKDKFIGLMNEKAKEAGLLNTFFGNSTGLGLSNFSTVEDLAKLAKYILKNYPSIFGITTLREFDLYTVDGKIFHKIINTDDLLKDSPDLVKRIIGGKTGNTRAAGQCLLLVVRSSDNQGYLINIILNSSDRFGEMKKIINWVDASYQWQTTSVFDPSSLNWEEMVSSAPWEKRDSQGVVVYNGKIWLMGGLDATGHVTSEGNVDYDNSKHFGDVWSSKDGTNWIKVADKSPWGNRRSIQPVDFNGKMWLMGGWGPEVGYKNDIWSSEDGVNWKLETASAAWPSREGYQLVVFQNKIWLIGGVRYDKHQLFNDVWYSPDGVNWTEATNNAGWSPRWDHSVGVFNNKFWLIGGMVFGGKMFKDVWYSVDGANWVLANANPPFETRQGGFVAGYKSKLWVIGRLDASINGGVNDIWYSEDGVEWQKTKNNPLWLGREDFGAVIFDDKIWVIGGMDRNWTWTNDVWRSTIKSN